MSIYDIAIIGLGPAGSTLARLVDTRLKVVAIDRKRLDGSSGGFQKPCGGLLAPSGQKALAEIGLNLPSSVLMNPQIFAIKTMDINSSVTRHYQRCYLNMDRHKFDLWLTSLIQPEVEVIDRAFCREIVNKGTHFEITLAQNNRQHTIQARQVVGADGSGSIVRRLLAHPIRRYICLQEFFPGSTSDFYGCFFDEQLTDSYGWVNNKNGLRILGAALPLNTPKIRFTTLKEKLKRFGYSFDQKPAGLEAALVSRPASLNQITAGQKNAFLIGEAAGLISPDSLEGISYAISSARRLSHVLNCNCPNPLEKYQRSLWPLKFKILNRLAQSPFMYQPHLRRLVMKSGLLALNI